MPDTMNDATPLTAPEIEKKIWQLMKAGKGGKHSDHSVIGYFKPERRFDMDPVGDDPNFRGSLHQGRA